MTNKIRNNKLESQDKSCACTITGPRRDELTPYMVKCRDVRYDRDRESNSTAMKQSVCELQVEFTNIDLGVNRKRSM